MRFYAKSDLEDYLLAQWWAEITADSSRDDLFVPPSSLGQMLAYFQHDDVKVIYEHDERGIWFLMWFVPMLSGMAASMWCRRDRRGKREHLEVVEWGYEAGLAAVPVLLGVTTQERLLKAHQRLGYTIVGSVPQLVGGKTGWLVALTREGWRERKARRLRAAEVVHG